ncbi:MAG: D-alanyl-D-alanine carboxypeptidase/D-alanyl-D-alanine-endopeptidase [Paludibacteraceae bacterium]|nr:D-alanyl-D-alanine carboxypeptidase/D-alanyl-D-alanine-endopeptidase [Paludibacteraceae bacterium]
MKNWKATIVALLLCCLPCTNIFAQDAGASLIGAAAVRKFVATDGLQAAGLGYLVKEVESENVIAEYQSGYNRIPASVTKLLTTATALEILSDTFSFVTKLNYSGYIKDSVLYGNLYVVGGGDPTFESDFFLHNPVFEHMVAAVESAGIKKIEGDVVGDASLFQRNGANGDWLLEDVGSYYGQTPSALCFHDNLFMITCTGSDTTPSVNIEAVLPRTNLLKIDNQLTSGTPAWWHIYGDLYSWDKTLRGNIPAGKKTLVRAEIPDPALFVADSLRNMLDRNGICSNKSRSTLWSNERAPETNTIYRFFSLPMKEIAKQTNYHSVNLFAENMFLYLGLQSSEIANYDLARAAVAKYWNTHGVPMTYTHQVDGSGLSMKNAISPKFLTDMLIYMKKKSKYADAFTITLPTAGKHGTVKNFLNGTLLAGKTFCKSGSMDRVQNFSGYVLWNGKWYAFTVMVNNFDCTRKQVRAAISNLLVDTFKAIGGPDAAVKKKVPQKKPIKKLKK